MLITLSPVRGDTPLTLERSGDALVVNGARYDFGPVAEGALLPRAAVPGDWFPGDVTREAGELRLTLRLPHGPEAPPETLFPQPLRLTGDGLVALPPYAAPEDAHAVD